jgi:hypothetical protein
MKRLKISELFGKFGKILDPVGSLSLPINAKLCQTDRQNGTTIFLHLMDILPSAINNPKSATISVL